MRYTVESIGETRDQLDLLKGPSLVVDERIVYDAKICWLEIG